MKLSQLIAYDKMRKKCIACFCNLMFKYANEAINHQMCAHLHTPEIVLSDQTRIKILLPRVNMSTYGVLSGIYLSYTT